MNNPVSSVQPTQLEVDDFVKAACEGNLEAVMEFLDKYGAAIDEANGEELTALMGAVRNGHRDIVELLLENGAQVGKQGNDGWTALMWAVGFRQQGMIELLLEKGADINAKTARGWTPLIFITQLAGDPEENKSVAELLLEKGAALDEKDERGKTALMYARQSSNSAMVALLEQWPEKQRRRELEEQKLREAQMMRDTDFSKGLRRPMPRPRPFNIKR